MVRNNRIRNRKKNRFPKVIMDEKLRLKTIFCIKFSWVLCGLVIIIFFNIFVCFRPVPQLISFGIILDIYKKTGYNRCYTKPNTISKFLFIKR